MPKGLSGKAGGFRLDTRLWNKFTRKLAAELGIPLKSVIESEALKVFQLSAKTVGRTTKAAAGGKFNPSSAKFKGWVRLNGKFYYVGSGQGGKTPMKYSASMWGRLMARLAAMRKRAETRVGLSKAVFYRLAVDLKLKGRSSGWADRSFLLSSYGKSGGMGKAAKSGPIWGTKKVASSTRSLRGKSPFIKFTVSSTNTFNSFTKGEGKVQAALKKRGASFEKTVLEETVKSANAIARKFPKIYCSEKMSKFWD